MREIAAIEAKDNFQLLLETVAGGESVEIMDAGSPVAVMMSFDAYSQNAKNIPAKKRTFWESAQEWRREHPDGLDVEGVFDIDRGYESDEKALHLFDCV